MTGKQNARVLDWMRRWGSITPAEAWKQGIQRLAARIKDLRDKGHDIVNTEPMGKPARYVLIAEAKAAA